MNENIFLEFYLSKNNQIFGPMMLENIYQLMHRLKLDGSEKISTDKKEWQPIQKLIPEIDKFLFEIRESQKIDTLLEKITIKTVLKVYTPFKIMLGPFNVKDLLKMIDENKLEKNYEIIFDNDRILYSKIETRLKNIITKLISDNENPKKAPEEDLNAISAVDIASLMDLSVEESQQQSYQENNVALSEEDSQGLLSTKPILSLLFTYSINGLTGILTIEKKNFEYKIKFSKGKLSYIESDAPELTLIYYLKNVKNIKIPFTLENEKSDERVIPSLIGMNLIQPSKIYDVLTEVVFFRLEDILKLTNGKFSFKGITLAKSDTNLNINLQDQFWKLTTGYIDKEMIDSYVKQIEFNVILKEERRFKYLSYLKLGPIELKLINKINNSVTTYQFLKALDGKDDYKELFKKLIYLLYQLKLVLKGDLIEVRDTNSEIDKYKKQLEEIEKDPNYFKILGLSDIASVQEIRTTYLRFAKDFHPDKLNKEQNEELKKIKTSIYTWISTAYSKISTQEKLDEYKNSLHAGPDVDTEKYFKADELFSKVKNSITSGNFEYARGFLNDALSLVSDNQEFYIYKHYIDFVLDRQKMPSISKTAISGIEEVLKVYPNYSEGYRFLAKMHKLSNNATQSKEYYQKLLKLIPYDNEAKRELAIK